MNDGLNYKDICCTKSVYFMMFRLKDVPGGPARRSYTPVHDKPNQKVINNDQQAKDKMKKYADKSRNVSTHDIRSGDTVLVKQPRRNKFSTPFEATPYIVETVKGSMITARRTTDRRRVTRNSSHYKKIQKARRNYNQPEVMPEEENQWSWNFEEESRASIQPEAEKKTNTTGTEESYIVEDYMEDPDQSQVVSELLTVRRSGRTRRKLVWTQDYQL